MKTAATMAGLGRAWTAYAKKLLLIVITVSAIFVAIGCHTVKGVGQDMGAAGKAIERSSGR